VKRLVLLLVLAGCTGRIGLPHAIQSVATGGGAGQGGGITATGGGTGTGGGSGAGGGDSDAGVAYLSNQDVYNRLKPTCMGCHTIDQRPFFADESSFENLIVYNLTWVHPQDPDNSDLLHLFDATLGTEQMPPLPSAPFATLDANHQTQISMAELRQWIRTLGPQSATPFDPVDLHRKSTAQIEQSLYDQLGLTEADFFNASTQGGVTYRVDANAGDAYAIRSVDLTPYSDPFGQGGSLYAALGGAYWLDGRLNRDDVTTNALQALVPISQAWCRKAVTKTGNTAVLNRATLNDATSTTAGEAAIRANIGYLYFRMLGEPAPSAEIDDLENNVFKPYEPKGAAVAWTAVCAALVRDPLWILY
jgi:hypothetical protein